MFFSVLTKFSGVICVPCSSSFASSNRYTSSAVKQIMKCKVIISVMPYAVKADAILNTVRQGVSNMVPATKLKEHADVTVYLDKDSAALLTAEELARFA